MLQLTVQWPVDMDHAIMAMCSGHRTERKVSWKSDGRDPENREGRRCRIKHLQYIPSWIQASFLPLAVSSIDASQERLGAAIKPVEARTASIEVESTSKRTPRQAPSRDSRSYALLEDEVHPERTR
jgi:hypothetical protein